jgi:hypothetical protein
MVHRVSGGDAEYLLSRDDVGVVNRVFGGDEYLESYYDEKDEKEIWSTFADYDLGRKHSTTGSNCHTS